MADLQTSVREPQWLADRRTRAAELAGSLELPSFKGTPGWEFTSLEKFSYDAFAAAAPGRGPCSRTVPRSRPHAAIRDASLTRRSRARNHDRRSL